MKIYKYFVLLVIIQASSIIYAQPASGQINGVVKSSKGIPLEFVNVGLKDSPFGNVTTASGEFSIKGIPNGKHILIISSVGYAVKEIIVNVEESETVFIPEIILHETAKELPEVLVQDAKINRYQIDASEYVAKLPLRNLENPQTYSTASKELLMEQNITTPSAALSSIPGGVVATEDGIGVLGLYLRGFYTQSYIRNGLLTLSANGGDIQTVERFELIKGPSGPLYGSSGVSYGGLLNKITKKPFSQNYYNAGFMFGSYNLQRFTADVNLPVNENKTALFRVNAAVHSEGSFQDIGHRKTFLAAPTFYSRISDKLDILLEAEINSIDLFAQTYFNGAPALDVNRIDEIGLDYFRSYSSNGLMSPPSILNNYAALVNYNLSGKWKVSLGSAFSDFNLNGIIIIPNFLNDSLMVRQVYGYNAQYNTITLQPAVTGEFQLGGFTNKMIAGFEYNWVSSLIDRFLDTNADTLNYRMNNNPVLYVDESKEGAELKFSERQSFSNYAVFVSDILSLTERLNLMLSLRYSYYDHYGLENLIAGINTANPYNQSAITPQAGATYQLIKNEISLFANYMEGYNNLSVNSQGQTFEPERAVQYEAGIKLDIFNGYLSSTLSYYNINVEDKIRRNPDNPLLSIQDGSQFSRGVDVDLRVHPFEGLNFLTGYTYNESRFTKSDLNVEGKRPLGTPKHTANLWSTYTFSNIINGFGIGMGITYSDEYFWNDVNTLLIPEYILIKGSIFYNASVYRINLTTENLLNKRYWDFEGTPQTPRNVVLSLNLIF